MTSWPWLVVDLDRCWGCGACEVACKVKLGLGPGPGALRVVEIGPRGIDGELQRDFVPVLCLHCDQAPCLEACGAGALYRAADGSVQVEASACTGCAVCQEACPYGAIQPAAGGSIVKCDLCLDRREEGWQPACVHHCPGRALALLAAEDLPRAVGGRFSWSVGRVVYVSGKYASLGEGLGAREQNTIQGGTNP
jgi:Fe-S-cluster-containing dehydrogenase component